MKIIPGINVAVIEGDTAHARWIEELGTIHHDPWFRDQILRHIKPGDVVVQGGANIGTLTRAMLDAGADIIVFEPNPEALNCLVHNCPEIRWRGQVFNGALSDTLGKVRFIKDQNAGASFCKSDASIDRHPVAKEGEVWCYVLDIPNTREPSLILLDIEGFEVRALRGAAQTIARCKPTIICEVNRGALVRAGTTDAELFALLESYGYSFTILQPDCRIGDPQYDILATPK